MKLLARGSRKVSVKGNCSPAANAANLSLNNLYADLRSESCAESPIMYGLESSIVLCTFCSRPSTVVNTPPRLAWDASKSSSGKITSADADLSTSLARSSSQVHSRVKIWPLLGMPPPPFTSLLRNPQWSHVNAMIITSLKCGMSAIHVSSSPGFWQLGQSVGIRMISRLPSEVDTSSSGSADPSGRYPTDCLTGAAGLVSVCSWVVEVAVGGTGAGANDTSSSAAEAAAAAVVAAAVVAILVSAFSSPPLTPASLVPNLPNMFSTPSKLEARTAPCALFPGSNSPASPAARASADGCNPTARSCMGERT
mmetsp:Transcript_48415/g.90254  ORF Transcript_48415/g.90254 Transcript_48415/m.90254 type:complete len:310 (+) Transcript_48415:817-1746(+)